MLLGGLSQEVEKHQTGFQTSWVGDSLFAFFFACRTLCVEILVNLAGEEVLESVLLVVSVHSASVEHSLHCNESGVDCYIFLWTHVEGVLSLLHFLSEADGFLTV